MSSRSILVDNLDTTTTLMGLQGVEAEDLFVDDVTLVSLILDMSGSMEEVSEAVVDGVNQEMLAAWQGSKEAEGILLSVWTFGDRPHLLCAHTPVMQVPELKTVARAVKAQISSTPRPTVSSYMADPAKFVYRPLGSTALYDAVLAAFAGISGYSQQLRDRGINTKCIVVVFSDGADNNSHSRVSEVHQVTTSLLQQEIYILAFVGFETFERVDYEAVAKSMGFTSIIVADRTPSDIRRMCGLTSRSVIRQSQTMIDPSKSQDFFTI